ncbi:hypothetical protein AB1Y20_011131 [Prymnesium parvum]|uniref:Uncharacterized protein n=1 Tax=Prymnesium parvum TaxID=97485 RepID=A0AB34IPI7_PRYPA
MATLPLPPTTRQPSAQGDVELLCDACQRGRLGILREILSRGVSPNARGPQGATPLVVACEHHRLDVIKLLLHAHAEPDLPAYGGVTALFTAASTNSPELVRLLCRAGARADGVCNSYYTPMLACTKLRDGEGVARVLLEERADANFQSEKWGTPLHAAASSGRAAVLRLLVAAEANLHALHSGQTALELAEQRGEAEAAKILRVEAMLWRRRQAKQQQAALRHGEEEVDESVAPSDGCEARKSKRRGGRGRKKGKHAPPPADVDGATALMESAMVEEMARAGRHAEALCTSTDGASDCVIADSNGSRRPGLRHSSSSGVSASQCEERRADALLAERALADMAGEAARKQAMSRAVDEVATALKHDGDREALRALAAGTAKKQAKAVAIECAAKSAKRDEDQRKLRELAMRTALMARTATREGMSLRSARDGSQAAMQQLCDAWLRQPK